MAAKSDLQPSVLAGPPAAVSGLVHFHNDTAGDVVIAEVTVTDPDGVQATLAVDPITVGAGRSARVAVRLALDPHTAPGAYPIEIGIAGKAAAATIHIVAAHEVGVTPEILVVENVPGESAVQAIVVANNGNVPVYLADFGAVPLYREDTALTTLLGIANRSSATTTALEPLPDAVTAIDVTTDSGRVEIAPGDTTVIDLTIGVPDDLAQSARYLAALPIALRTLLIAVVPAGPEDGSK